MTPARAITAVSNPNPDPDPDPYIPTDEDRRRWFRHAYMDFAIRSHIAQGAIIKTDALGVHGLREMMKELRECDPQAAQLLGEYVVLPDED